MKEKSRLTISFEILKNPHIELHDKIVYSVIATLMVDDLLEITFDELALKCGFKRRQIIKSVNLSNVNIIHIRNPIHFTFMPRHMKWVCITLCILS